MLIRSFLNIVLLSTRAIAPQNKTCGVCLIAVIVQPQLGSLVYELISFFYATKKSKEIASGTQA